MTEKKPKLRIYTVVDVWRGIVVGIRNFRRLKNAQLYMRRLRVQRNLQEDDVQLFEATLPISSQGKLLTQLTKRVE